MGGRYQLTLEWDDLAQAFGLADPTPHPRWKGPRYNHAPRQSVAVVRRRDDGTREGLTMRWGFPPQWVRKQGKEPFDAPPLINAKAEDAHKKPTWSRALRERRCLVPTTGFYEWIKRDGERFPLLFRPANEPVLAFAGIWGGFDWGEKIGWPCMAFLTVKPNAGVKPVHNRMPALLTPDQWAAWLDPETPLAEVRALATTPPDELLEAVEVNTALNGWSAEGPETQLADWSR